MKRILVIAGVVCGIAGSLLSAQARLQPWQQSWSAYGAELGKQLGAGVHPDSEVGKKIFYSKSVSWEGALRLPFKGEPKERIELTMDTIEFPVALNLFPGQSGASGTTRVKVTQLGAWPAASAVDAWKKVAVGSKVRFRANTGTSPVIIFAMQRQGDSSAGGALILVVDQAEPIAP